MRNLLSLTLGAIALLGAACAQSEPLPNDGQTHWMQRCDSDAECGALACVCGVCTETCSSDDDACVVAEAAVCARSTDALGGDACESDSVRVCVPACERQADCDAIDDQLTCSEETLCALDEAVGPGHEPPDSAVVEGDAGELDSGPIDPPDPDALIEVACESGGMLGGEGFELIASSTFKDSLVIAPDGTMYTLFEDEDVLTHVMEVRAADGNRALTTDVYNIIELVMDGDELFVMINDNGYESRIARIDRQSGAATYLAREEALNPHGIAFDAEWIYWSAQVSQEPDVQTTRVWRSPREPGETDLLAELDGDARTLHLVGGALYLYTGASAEEARLHRIATDGSGVEVLDGGPHDLGGVGLISDGTSLFAFTGGGYDDLGNNKNDARIHKLNLETLELEELFAAGRGNLVELIFSGDFMYWVMDENRETADGHATQNVWRGRKDGTDAAEKIADVIGWAQPIAVDRDRLYWLSGCRLEPQRHIVRVAL